MKKITRRRERHHYSIILSSVVHVIFPLAIVIHIFQTSCSFLCHSSCLANQQCGVILSFNHFLNDLSWFSYQNVVCSLQNNYLIHQNSHRQITSQFSSSSLLDQHRTMMTTAHLKPFNTLYLGDLPFACTPQRIVKAFRELGYAVTVKVVFRFGFAHFKTNHLATKAHDELQNKIIMNGRTIRICYAGHSIMDRTLINTLTSPINSVHVRFHTTSDIICVDEALLKAFFVPYGTIIDVCIIEVSVCLLFLFSSMLLLLLLSCHVMSSHHHIVSPFVADPIQSSRR